MSKRWIRCRINKGMFSDEVVVVIKTHSGEQASFFVPRTEVKETGHTESVCVQLFGDSLVWAIVPNEDQTMVPLDESEILAA